MSNWPKDNIGNAPRNTASDIAGHGWIADHAPASLRPYLVLLRLDRPIGTWLLLLPCWWGLALATTASVPPMTVLYYGILFAIGAVAMRGAGCIVNDIYDRKFDSAVARTADRPIPSGTVSVPRALIVLTGMLFLGFVVLVQFNTLTIVVGAASLVLVFTYPLMKRVTYWPQIFLGLAFNWGALVGWTSLREELSWPSVALYLAGIAWTLGYDTIYAHQDKEDDALIGLKSTALLFGPNSAPLIASFFATTIIFLGIAGVLTDLHWIFFVGLTIAALHLCRQLKRVDLDQPKSCLYAFKSNRNFGLIVTATLLAGQFV